MAAGGVCPNDLGPNSFVFRDGTPIALIDFDMAAPGERLDKRHEVSVVPSTRPRLAARGTARIARSGFLATRVAAQSGVLTLFSASWEPIDHLPDAPEHLEKIEIQPGSASMSKESRRVLDEAYEELESELPDRLARVVGWVRAPL